MTKNIIRRNLKLIIDDANKKNELSVIKSNKLITAQFKMELNEQKIILLCIAKIKKNTKKSDKKESSSLYFDFTAKEIQNFLNVNSKGIYGELKSIANRLTKHRIYLSDGKNFKFIVPIPFCEYKNGVFTIRFEKVMEEYLLELRDKFTMYSLENIRTLKSNYSIRIYELLKSYEWLGEKVNLI